MNRLPPSKFVSRSQDFFMRRLPIFLGILSVAISSASTAAGEKTASAEAVRFFESTIRPLFDTHCLKCHGPAKQRGDFRLDSRAALLKGGETGPAVVVGQPESSLLMKAVRHASAELKMPPDKKLSDREIASLARWIQMGVPFPEYANVKSPLEKGKEWWAFQPVKKPAVPKTKHQGWAKTPLDSFVLGLMEAKGLQPAPPADRRTLIRRVSFDLIGLPPTPEEVDAFVKDSSPDAFAKVVDRLLASPHYGERWGRHWLDVARYADSNGLDENVAFGNAWRYRDYVVASFNQDLPFNQFITEQLAGDLLESKTHEERQRRLIATGFLSLGPKVLAEVDEKKMELDIVDEQIDTMGRAFMGMTFNCARCHDHKFDPISTSDYYAMAGIFQSTHTMEHFRKVAKWHENPLAKPEEIKRKADHDGAIAKHKKSLTEFLQKAQAEVKAKDPNKAKLAKIPEEQLSDEAKVELKKRRAEIASLEKSAPELPSAMGVKEGKILDAPIHLRGDVLKVGKVVPRGVPGVMLAGMPIKIGGQTSGRLELANWLTHSAHPLTARVLVNRIWAWHFGQGLVRSVDNFGTLGELPENPALLDWLANQFVESGWSMKAMHRLILLSATYQASAQADATAMRIDPENRFLSHFSVRRLDAEVLRDAMLAVAGNLDTTRGGSLLHVKNRDYFFDHTSKDHTKYDSLRRSLYLPVVRNNVYDVFQLFDFPDPAVSTGNRNATTVAPQALFMLNSDLMLETSQHFAATLLKENLPDDAARIAKMYRKAFGRASLTGERDKALAFLAEIDRMMQPRESDPNRRRAFAWACLCQTVLASNEFVYVE